MKLCSFCVVWITFHWVNVIVILMLKPVLKVGITKVFSYQIFLVTKLLREGNQFMKNYLQDITWLLSTIYI